MELCNLKTLTPVHIGSGRYLMRNNEFICTDDRNIGIVDDKKVLEIIGEENIGQWLSVINKDQSVWDLLTRRSPGLKLSEISKRYYKHYAVRTDGFHLKEQLIDGMGQPYIPGSSLKGAIRSAVFEYLLQQNNTEIKKSDISSVSHGKEKLSAKKLEEKLFGKDPNNDFFRFLLTGDALFKPDSLVGLGVESLNIKRNDVISDKSKYLLTEAIDKNINTSFRFKINNNLLQKNIRHAGMNSTNTKTLSSVSGLFKIINDHTLMLLELERNFWEDYAQHTDAGEYLASINKMLDETGKSKKNECVLRVGYGSGWLFMTGGWAKHDYLVSDELFELIVEHSQPQSHKYVAFDFPKSRRMTINHELFGFVKLSV